MPSYMMPARTATEQLDEGTNKGQWHRVLEAARGSQDAHWVSPGEAELNSLFTNHRSLITQILIGSTAIRNIRNSFAISAMRLF
jgi:hypothetical protein